MTRKRGQNEGSIFQRRDGRWCAVLNLGWENGRRRRKSVNGHTAEAVQSALLKLRHDSSLGLPIATARQTVGDFLTRWLEDYSRPRIKPRSYERFAEIIRLQRIGGKLQLTETKTPKSRRTVPLPRYAVRALRAHRARQLEERLAAGSAWTDSDLVFTNRLGGPIEPTTLRLRFRRLLAQAGLPQIRLHDLRHGAASLMLAQGVPMKTIQEILGHSSISITADLYAHFGEQLKREAADAMDALMGEYRAILEPV